MERLAHQDMELDSIFSVSRNALLAGFNERGNLLGQCIYKR